MLRVALRLRSWRVALAASALTGAAMLPSRLLGLHGVESAVVLGLVLPPFVGVAAARMVEDRRRRGIVTRAPELMVGAIGAALLCWALPVGFLALNALRFRQCTPLGGLAYMLLGPGFAVVLAALSGLLAAVVVPRPRLGAVVAGLVPVAVAGLALYRLWATPTVHTYSHFVGYAPGTLYDEGIRIAVPYLTFRGVGLVTLGALAALLTGLMDPASLRPRGRRRGPLLLGLALSATVLAADAYGPELGHRTTVASIADALGATLRTDRCVLHAPRELPRAQLERLGVECDFHVDRIERFLGVRQRTPITAFFFRSAEEKQLHVGAGSTYVAKPWRNEVYLQLAGWPHPVLPHELVHVVAGNASTGPLRISGDLGGLVPNPGLIEGMAVAAAWDLHEDLTPHQWARALLELGELPALSDVMGLSFGALSPRQAYASAGSFVRFLHDRRGAEAVRAAYRAGEIADVAELEAAWRAYLGEIPIDDDAMARVQVVLFRRSLLSAVCPHRVADLRRQAAADAAAGDDDRLRSTCEELARIDPADARSSAALVGALARLGDTEAAQRELAHLEGPLEAPGPLRVSAREELADAAWARGDTDRARTLIEDLLERPLEDDVARRLEVKREALARGGREAALAFTLFVGEEHRGASPAVAVHVARELDTARPDGLGAYLEGRQLYNQASFELAIPFFVRAADRGLPSARLARENRRLLAISTFAVGDRVRARGWFEATARDPEASAAARFDAQTWVQRCDFALR